MQWHFLSKICDSSFWSDCYGPLIAILPCIFILGYLIIRPPLGSKDPIGFQENLIAGVHGYTNMSYYRLFMVG